MRKNKDLMSKLINLTSVKYIYDFLCELFKDVISDSELINQILLFLMNLLEDNQYIQYIYYKYKYSIYYTNIFWIIKTQQK